MSAPQPAVIRRHAGLPARAERRPSSSSDLLRAAWPGLTCAIRPIVTTGDRTQASGRPLPEIGGKGLFTVELEQALHDGTIDLAVHSLKDLPTEAAAGVEIGAVCARDDVRECLVSRDGLALGDLPAGAVVGTSSLRRQAQLSGAPARSRDSLDSRERGHADPQGARGRVRRRAPGCRRCPAPGARRFRERVAGARDDAPRSGTRGARDPVPRRRRARSSSSSRRSTTRVLARRRRPSVCFSRRSPRAARPLLGHSPRPCVRTVCVCRR